MLALFLAVETLASGSGDSTGGIRGKAPDARMASTPVAQGLKGQIATPANRHWYFDKIPERWFILPIRRYSKRLRKSDLNASIMN